MVNPESISRMTLINYDWPRPKLNIIFTSINSGLLEIRTPKNPVWFSKKSSSDCLAELIWAWPYDIKCSIALHNWLQKVEVVLNGHGQRGKKKPLRGYPIGPSSFISLDNLLTIDHWFFYRPLSFLDTVQFYSLWPSSFISLGRLFPFL